MTKRSHLDDNITKTITICDYISSLKSEVNPSDHYRKDVTILLCNLSIFLKNAKHFKEITREDLLSFLDGYRKTENINPLHKCNFLKNCNSRRVIVIVVSLYFMEVLGYQK